MRATILQELLLQFTHDPRRQELLRSLMAREVAHFRMFAAALASNEPNFSPGVLPGDPRFTNTYYSLPTGEDAREPWNQGRGKWHEGAWAYIPVAPKQLHETEGQLRQHSGRINARRGAPVDFLAAADELSCH